MVNPFLLVVVDHDKKTYSVHGPMKDDTAWNEAVCAAQDAGRYVQCFATPSEESLGSWEAEHWVQRVPAVDLPWADPD